LVLKKRGANSATGYVEAQAAKVFSQFSDTPQPARLSRESLDSACSRLIRRPSRVRLDGNRRIFHPVK
jgi:hypothetical protein